MDFLSVKPYKIHYDNFFVEYIRQSKQYRIEHPLNSTQKLSAVVPFVSDYRYNEVVR